MMSRSSTYGYDQRCEFFGTKGLLKVENHFDSSCELSDGDGIQNSVFKFSFPRDSMKHSKRSSYVCERMLHGERWPITEYDCVQAQNVAIGALNSCQNG